jgi:hypothetical protein
MASTLFILPESLVRLSLKIAKSFDITDCNLFSILDTLQFALEVNFKAQLSSQASIDEKEMTILIVNIIRLSEKYNKAYSKLTKVEITKIFGNLQIDRKEVNDKEFEHFKSFNYDVKEPKIVELIYNLIDIHLDTINMTKDSLMTMALDILKIFYCWRVKIYEEVQKTNQEQAKDVIADQRLIAVSILFVVMKLLNLSERIIVSVFDAMCEELENGFEAKEVNHLSGIIFGLIKK